MGDVRFATRDVAGSVRARSTTYGRAAGVVRFGNGCIDLSDAQEDSTKKTLAAKKILEGIYRYDQRARGDQHQGRPCFPSMYKPGTQTFRHSTRGARPSRMPHTHKQRRISSPSDQHKNVKVRDWNHSLPLSMYHEFRSMGMRFEVQHVVQGTSPAPAALSSKGVGVDDLLDLMQDRRPGLRPRAPRLRLWDPAARASACLSTTIWGLKNSPQKEGQEESSSSFSSSRFLQEPRAGEGGRRHGARRDRLPEERRQRERTFATAGGGQPQPRVIERQEGDRVSALAGGREQSPRPTRSQAIPGERSISIEDATWRRFPNRHLTHGHPLFARAR